MTHTYRKPPSFLKLLLTSLNFPSHEQFHPPLPAAIPRDGIGVEVVEAALQVIQAAAEASGEYTVQVTELPRGGGLLQENWCLSRP